MIRNLAGDFLFLYDLYALDIFLLLSKLVIISNKYQNLISLAYN